jgi:DNA-binding NarL/FixJ family response regulator
MKALIAADPTLLLVGEAHDGKAALDRALVLSPDVAVLDLSMPDLTGIEVARQLRIALPACRVLILTMHEDAAYLRPLLELGIGGYVLKRSAMEQLSRGIHAVAAGGTYLDPAVGEGTAPPAATSPPAEGTPELSPRELEVLQLTAAGHSNKMIAAHMAIGVKTVDTYKARAMTKLGFRSRVEVVRFALSRGWLTEA